MLDTGDEKVVRTKRVYDLILVGFFVLIGVIMGVFIFKKYKFKKMDDNKQNGMGKPEDNQVENFIY